MSSPTKPPSFDGETWVYIVLLVLSLVIALSGCVLVPDVRNVTLLTEVSHTSHATQHVGSNRSNYGWNVVSAGIRWRPTDSVTVDVLEGYSFEPVNGRHEVFNLRVQMEFGKGAK